jgi:GAF domain-containing protein
MTTRPDRSAPRRGPVTPETIDAAVGRLHEHGASDRDVVGTLQRVVASAAELVGASGSGLMVVDDEHVSRYVVATDGPGRHLERAQVEVDEGPCTDATVHGEVVVTSDVTTDARWPRLAPLMVGTGVVAVLGAPVTLAGTPIGSIDVYADGPRTWDASEIDAVRSHASVAEHIIGSAVLADRHDEVVRQLETALANRVVIERAVGMVMAWYGDTPVAAFQRLRSTARNRRVKVASLAEALVEGRERNLDPPP